MQRTSLNDISSFLNGENWRFDEAKPNESFNYKGLDLNYDIVMWGKSSYNYGGKITIYHKQGKPNIVFYETTKECFQMLFNEFASTTKGNAQIKENILITYYNENDVTVAFYDKSNNYSDNDNYIVVYNPAALQKQIERERLVKSTEELKNTRVINSTTFNGKEYYYDVIIAFLKAEDNRDFDLIYSFFSPQLKRYYHLNDPDYSKLRESYETAWSFTSNPKNQIEEIEDVDEYTYDVLTTFSFYNQKKKEEQNVISKVRFIFDRDGKIIETYNITFNRDSDQYQEITVNPQDNGGNLGQVTFYQKYGQTLFYFENRTHKGEIVINGIPYELTELSFDKNNSSYHISGDQVKVQTSKIIFSPNEEGTDCEYGKCDVVKVIMNERLKVLKDIQVQDCPVYD